VQLSSNTTSPRFIYGARAFEGHELERRLQGDLHFCCSGLDIRESAVELSTSGHRAGQPACGKEQRRTYYGNVGSRSTPARFSIRCGRVGSARRFGGWVGWVVFVFLLSLAWCSHDGRGWREREGGEGEREREDESNRVEPSLVLEHQYFPPARLTDFFTLPLDCTVPDLPFLTLILRTSLLPCLTRTTIIIIINSCTPCIPTHTQTTPSSCPSPPTPPSGPIQIHPDPPPSPPVHRPRRDPSSCTDVLYVGTVQHHPLDDRAGMYLCCSPIMYLSVWSRVQSKHHTLSVSDHFPITPWSPSSPLPPSPGYFCAGWPQLPFSSFLYGWGSLPAS
jgi:hypothetical protein